jgi:phospholipid/cholesterol/gamma-HCH transport system substrate-binding protein
MIGDRRMMFDDQFELSTTFTRVTGLGVGTGVRLSGLDAGEVEEIVIPSLPSEPFVVRMRLREDLRTLIRADSVASILTDGIVGNAFIQLSVGSDDAAVVADGDTIAGRDPIAFADLIEEGRDTFRVVSEELVALQDDVSAAIQAMTATVESANVLISDVGRDVTVMTTASAEVIQGLERVMAETEGAIADVRAGEGTIGRLLTDDTLYRQLLAVSSETEAVVANVRGATDRVNEAVEAFIGRDGTAQQVAQTLRNTLAEVQEVTSDLAEGTEALKRNFLFRGFFTDRGFFDLDTVSREAYVAGVLEGDDRTALRIWIGADGLFVPDETGGIDRLTDEGRRRVDSAMADLMRYPRDSPLVVEGYAESQTGEAAYLRSVDRAQTVRDYLLGRFRLQSTLTGVMPMSDQATGSPRGDGRWSGVALTLFVSNEALSAARLAGAQ